VTFDIDDIDDLIDATPSGEVQMRVKGGLDIGRSGTPMRDSRTEIDTERLTKSHGVYTPVSVHQDR
jgi:hypothetical protein